ncbi:glycoside hydrolase family 3 N-terminal domain-containing protein [Chryseobacterium gambrini]|uniref:Glycoside hydrolase family 3 N-terminal domain-containing protein n=1 Tax=Chryseobacterium gambrini TaxID=373672 RepID=A0AAJ1R6W5_9FLAO|nr:MULTISPECIES: beta-glucosidase [Chryseobacterium]MDN4014803.1 glycoside hydrolase family 3 N-terminal domain-containing protein [Chryseobacterium gambrini]MDN4027889.1 glycoside hydrolase family 3 N-terminal domain-containing protein [Chryseobacterium gambrini]QWA39687.1 glycoside hydrolase family 3 C-terminal domain-containing protein [Chryseobacterium sp. ZHDP1]
MSLKLRFKIIGISLLSTVFISAQKTLYKDPKQPVEARVQDLLKRMTPEEKFWQCFMIPGDLDNVPKGQYSYGIFGLQVSAGNQGGGVAGQMLKYNANEDAERLAKKINAIQKYFVEESRLGIPIIPFDEALHGLMREGATAFPQAIGLSATFNPELMKQVSRAIAKESKLRGIRQILTPVVNLASDVRWGRTEETYGEDPFLTSVMGVNFVSSFENQGIITTPKHFLANVGEGGRDSYPIHWSRRYLEETHLIPFQKAFQQGKSRSVMTSYNLLDGRPSTANHWLLTEKLKKDWNFKGFVISDASAVGGANVLHFTAKDYDDASAQAINAGLDVIFQTEYQHYKLFIPPFLDGRISQERIDDAVARVLRAKFELGLFENPYVSNKDIAELKKINHKTLAEKAAAESFVLLQNNNHTLPISEKYKKILVVGTDAVDARLGGYSGPGNKKVSILDGIKNFAKNKNIEIAYSKGIDWNVKDFMTVPAEVLSSENQKGLKGSYFSNSELNGDPAFEKQDEQLNFKWTLYSPNPEKLQPDNYSVRWKGKLEAPKSGKYQLGLRGNDGFRLILNGSLLIDHWEKLSYSTKTVEVEFNKGQKYDIVVEFHENRGEANIELIWNYGLYDYQKDFNDALKQAQNADYIIVTAGIHEGEFQDRSSLSLSGNQEKFIHELSKLNKPTTVVLIGGSAIKTIGWKEKVGAILDVWYPGEEGGNAVAKVLFGEENPSGKLPITFPVEEGQLPLTYNHHPTGRGNDYYDLSGEPLYPFGFGLSYTTFEISDLQLNKTKYSKNDVITAKVTVKNTGSKAGSEVVQLYVKDLLASVSRPIIELKGFQKVYLKPGESKQISITVPAKELQFLDEKMNWIVEKGTYRIFVGNSSKNLPLKHNIEVE